MLFFEFHKSAGSCVFSIPKNVSIEVYAERIKLIGSDECA